MACGINFLSENFADEASISLTTGTENAQFPLVNIQNQATAVKFRSVENSVVIVFDLLQVRTIDAIALHGDTNADLGLTTASVKTSLTTDFSSSTPQNITLSAENLLGYLFFVSPVSHRYVELTLTGNGSFVEVSNIFIGERIYLQYQNLSISSFDYGYMDMSTVDANKYGQKFIDKRNQVKFIGGSIDFATIAEHEELDNMFIRHGISEPLWMIVDEDGVSIADGEFKLTIYGYLEKRPNWSASGGQTYNTNVKIVQAG